MSPTSIETQGDDLRHQQQIEGSFSRHQLLALDKLNSILLERDPLEQLQLRILQQLCQIFEIKRCWFLAVSDLEYDRYRFVAVSADCEQNIEISHSPFASHFYLRALRAKSSLAYFQHANTEQESTPSLPFSSARQQHFKVALGHDCAYVLGVEKSDKRFDDLEIQQLSLIAYRISMAASQNAQIEQAQHLFLSNPVALCYLDISRLRSTLEKLGVETAQGLMEHIKKEPKLPTLLANKIRLSRVNRATLTLFEASGEADFLANLPYLVNHSMRQAFIAALQAMVEQCSEFKAEIAVTSLRGKALHLMLAFTQEDERKDNNRYLALSLVDIAPRFHAEQSERENALDYAAATRIANDIYWQLNTLSGNVVFSNAWYQQRGVSQTIESADINDWYNSVFIDDLPNVTSILQSLISGERHQSKQELRVIRSDGQQRWIQLSLTCDTDENEVRYLHCIEVDITEHKLLQQRLKLSATVFDNTIEGIVIIDANNKIIEVNPAFSEIIGYSHSELIGFSPLLWHSDRQGFSFYRNIKKSLYDTGKWSGEIWNKRKDGTVVPQWLAISCVYDERGRLTHQVAVFSDISQLKKSQAQLQRMAHYDQLTDLPNRYLLGQRIDHAIEHAKRNKLKIAICYLDLDNFKHYNDSLGHAFGDKLLQCVARHLVEAVRSEDTVSRIGGDEFIIVLSYLDNIESISPAIAKIIDVINQPFSLDDQEAQISASIGVAVYPDDGANSEVLISNADAAMYRAKNMGRNNFQFYSEEMTQHSMQRILLNRDIHRAISSDELLLHFQPQFCLSNHRVIGVEALIRWHHPELGFLSPDSFIPLAEESSLIIKIGSWVLDNACQHIALWRREGLSFGKVAINIAVLHLCQADFVSEVIALLKRYQIPAECLELEITESSLMQQVDQVVGNLQSLRQLGVDISIDDFGTGYSSLSYLKQLPINKLKIDRSFISDILDSEEDVAIAETIIVMGEKLGLTVIAEGIETKAQLALLKQCNCHQGQGYLFSKPLNKEGIERFLKQHQSALHEIKE